MCSQTGIASVYVIPRQISVKAISFRSSLGNVRTFNHINKDSFFHLLIRCLLPVGFFNLVMLHLNYLFLSI